MARRERFLLEVLHRPEPRVGLAVGLVTAIVLHIAVVPGAQLLPGRAMAAQSSSGSWSGRAPLQQAQEQKRIDIELLHDDDKAKDDDELPRGQVVNLPQNFADEAPVAADFLAEQNHRADRETRAKLTGMTETITKTPSLAKPVMAPTQQPPQPQSTPTEAIAAEARDATPGGPAGDGTGTVGDAIAPDSKEGGGEQTLAMLTPHRERQEALRDTGAGALRARERQEGLDGNSTALRIAMARIAPLQAPLGASGFGFGFSRIGGSGSGADVGKAAAGVAADTPQLVGLPRNDYLLVEEDDATSLNAMRYRHATYFNRIADAIRRTWAGGETLRRVDPTGRVYGSEDRATVVVVTIDEEGNIADLAIRDPSGADPLDDEALRAVRAAGPFLHPPKGLFAKSKHFSFAFGFHVNFNRKSFDLNWAPY